MPGRPRTTLKTLTELLKLAESYALAVYELMPAHYDELPDPGDPVCAAWHHAKQAAVNNYRALDVLRELIEQKVERADQKKALRNVD